MQISPGTQLVWSLSGSEAVNLGMPTIEPDHLFCALLKFSELDEGTIKSLLKDAGDLPNIIEERDELGLALEDLGRSTAEIRHEIRKEAEHGTHKLEGNLIHRSEASRKLFQLAIEKANSQNQPVHPTHLLAIILADPTPAMKKVLEPDDGVPKWLKEMEEGEPEQEAAEAPSSWLRPISDLAPARGFQITDTSWPQINAIAKVLKSSNPFPTLLVCEQPIKALPILWKTDRETDDLSLLSPDIESMNAAFAGLENPETADKEIQRVVAETLTGEAGWVFFDLTGGTPDDEQNWESLKPLLQKQCRLVVAMREKMYQKFVVPDVSSEAGFRIIWLHDLSKSHSLDQL